ncbi:MULTISPECIES: PHP domain-containing protein [unclassified Ruminococcus]|uniref:PHP domain-containing protein n=1 Tax=unclassified Ruminococcus TaxID=2608920 RepID=UPI00210D9573|nr:MULTISPECIES: PHP domain-containing protein [unclassified Ruminococcus]MCQ4022451.1 PHP domain-containing protein [Ruminococcus sp. zg-924]MCQ4115715.1 PHP domain-containing protein [Ruminococcus sp. zg-921]
MAADLHCHTKLSDGSVPVDELITLAKGSGLTAIALTDHDTFSGVKTAQTLGAQAGLEVIPGAEISCFDNKRHRLVHILCYYPDKPEMFDSLFDAIAKSRKKEVTIALEKIMKYYPITHEMVQRRAQGSVTIFKQHIMHTLLDAGYTDKIYGELYKELFGYKTGIARTNIEYPDAFEILDMIHKSGAVAVLAHPSVYDSLDLLPELAEKGLDGVEYNFPRRKPGEDKVLDDIVKNYDLIKTGGTDFHGGSTSQVHPIGTCTTDEGQLLKLKKLKNII